MTAKGRIAIIGAGLAGLGAAGRLSTRGFSVCLFEKSRGLGGRCATRRWEGRLVDHGAQYFTMRHPDFVEASRAACDTQLLQIKAPIMDDEMQPLHAEARWHHSSGNSALAKGLAKSLGPTCEMRLETMIDSAQVLLKKNGGDFEFVICTAPWPQTKALLGHAVEPADFTHTPCLTAVFAYRGVGIGCTQKTYAFTSRKSPLAWSSCENHKNGRSLPGETLIIAQMSDEFSKEHLETDPVHYPALIRPFVETRWELDGSDFLAGMGHRWRYARSVIRPPTTPLHDGILFAGDSFGESRLESAWLSGWEAAGRLIAMSC